MRSSVLGAAAIAGRALAEAPPSTGNPPGVVYQATLPDEPFFADADIEGNVKGSITAVAREDGNGVRFTVKFENLPAEGGPFTYHIHEAPAEDGNCTTTLAHLDPFEAGVEIPCDPEAPETCEVGDLAGKHGKIDSDPYEKHYSDLYAATNPDSESYFGDLSFVLHYANSTRLTCANFERKVKAPAPAPTPKPSCDADETPAPTEIVEPPVETVVVPCEKGCDHDGGDEGDHGSDDGDDGHKDDGHKDKGDEDEQVEDGDHGDDGGHVDDGDDIDEGDEGDDGDDTVVPPPPADDDVPTPTPTDAGGPEESIPVEAGAMMKTLSLSLMSVGLAVAAFMTS